jgi:hypothetical protein
MSGQDLDCDDAVQAARVPGAIHLTPYRPHPAAIESPYGPNFVPKVRAMCARNYSLHSTLERMRRFWVCCWQTKPNLNFKPCEL